jgi:LEM3 (ligand-effect modulator 3) family / CDC50 family
MLSKNKGLKETPNYKLGIFFFCILGTNFQISLIFLVIIYMTLGIIFIVYSSNIQSYSVYYDDECGTASECSITIDVQETMEGPVYFYYSLDNFYQNHFEYINSVDFDQLQGREKPASELESCEPRILVRDSPNTIYNLNGEKMFSDDVLFPCGIIAETIFNGRKKKENYFY